MRLSVWSYLIPALATVTVAMIGYASVRTTGRKQQHVEKIADHFSDSLVLVDMLRSAVDDKERRLIYVEKQDAMKERRLNRIELKLRQCEYDRERDRAEIARLRAKINGAADG